MVTFKSNTIQVHIAAYDENELKYLLLRRSEDVKVYPSIWQTITGTIEPDETAVQAAFRETMEEVSLKPIRAWTVPYVTSFFIHKRNQIGFSPVFGFLVEYNATIQLSTEHQAYQWLNFEDAIKLLVLPSHKEALTIFHNDILNNNYVLSKSIYELEI